MRRAIAADFAAIAGPPSVRVIVTLDSRMPEDDGPWTIERIAPGESVPRLRQLAQPADFTVLIGPETMGVLAQLTRELDEAGARTLGSTAEAVELTGDKMQLAECLKNAGIDTPPTRFVTPAAGLPFDASYPAVVKPVDGAGSLDTFLITNPYGVPRDLRALPAAILQPFVPGVPMSASFLVGLDGEAYLIGIGAQRMAIRDGRFEYRGGIVPISCPGALAQLTPAVALIPGLRGFVGVDFLWEPTEHHATVLEINPRPTTSYVGLAKLLGPGVLARAWLNLYDTSAPGNRAPLRALADDVHRQPPVSFDSSGSFLTGDELSK